MPGDLSWGVLMYVVIMIFMEVIIGYLIHSTEPTPPGLAASKGRGMGGHQYFAEKQATAGNQGNGGHA